MKARGRIHSLAFSPDGRFLASIAQDLPSADPKNPTASELARLREALREAGATLQVWDTTTGQPCGPPAKARVLHTDLAFSPDGRYALTLSDHRPPGAATAGGLLRAASRWVVEHTGLVTLLT